MSAEVIKFTGAWEGREPTPHQCEAQLSALHDARQVIAEGQGAWH